MADPNGIIKMCTNPECGEIAHKVQLSERKCRSCKAVLKTISSVFYAKKHLMNPDQFDYSSITKTKVTPMELGYAVQLDIPF